MHSVTQHRIQLPRYVEDLQHISYKRFRATPNPSQPALHARFQWEFNMLVLWAVSTNRLHALRFLKEWGCTLQDLRAHGNACLYQAAIRGHLPMLQALKDWQAPDGSCLTLWDVESRPILHDVAKRGHAHVLQFFKDWRDDVEQRRAHCPERPHMGCMPTYCCPTSDRLTLRNIRACNALIQTAASHGHLPVLRLLKLWRDDTKRPDHKDGHLVSFDNPAIRWPVACAPRITLNDLRKNDNYALRKAAKNGHLHVLHFLKQWRGKNGCRLTLQDVRTGQNEALFLAATAGHVDVLQFFKDWRDASGSHLTVQDLAYPTDHLLGKVAEHGHVHVLQFLKDWRDPDGARVTLNDIRSSWRCLTVAVKNGHVRVLQFFRDWVDPGPDRLSVQDLRRNSHSILRAAVEGCNLEILRMLRDWPSEGHERLSPRDACDNECRSLNLPAAWGYVPVFQFLKEWGEIQGVNPITQQDLRDPDNRVVKSAAEGGHVVILEMIKEHWGGPQRMPTQR
jgi:hypothetical protein